MKKATKQFIFVAALLFNILFYVVMAACTSQIPPVTIWMIWVNGMWLVTSWKMMMWWK